jgi:hypothetical protein
MEKGQYMVIRPGMAKRQDIQRQQDIRDINRVTGSGRFFALSRIILK